MVLACSKERRALLQPKVTWSLKRDLERVICIVTSAIQGDHRRENMVFPLASEGWMTQVSIPLVLLMGLGMESIKALLLLVRSHCPRSL